ncbi:MAG TPA: LamG domain-containing protein, partial [Bacteroidia bacterium]|nr:LamG domain-containing protein [Bacteroidia bacterium]
MALLFNGSTDYLEQAVAVFGSTGATPCSFAFWFKPTNNTGTQTIMCTGSNGSNTDYINARTASGVFTTVFDGATGNNQASTTPTTATVGSWNHIVATYTSRSSTAIYLNGVAGGASSGTASAYSDLAQTLIGALLSANAISQFANGAVAYPAAWNNVALTQAQVTTLYNSGSGFDPRNLSGAAPNASFSLLQTATAPPDSVTGNNWTVHGSPSLVADPFSLGNAVPSVSNVAASSITATSATFN